MVADKCPNGLIGPNPNGPIGPIGLIFPIVPILPIFPIYPSATLGKNGDDG